KDSEALFKDMFTIEDVVTNGVRLFRNRKPQQYIGYRLDQKYKPVIDLVPIPTHPARRVRLYDFFKGRPGSYILLTETGEPISIKQAGHDFTIVNIRSDGDVSIIVDLESTALQQFHRISLNDILLIME
ncbi:MAG: hypothetical protein H3C43_06895, partial [Leptonema sp. (in: Bacteria)]|nr:hypothetical protein [Leptonema sp. (in: bacteria)]